MSATNFSDTLGSSFTAGTDLQLMGGGQIGINYQFWGGVIVGAEAMFDWVLGTRQSSPVTATDPTGAVSASVTGFNERWIATATGRLGYAWDRVLLYAKGGGAWVATNSPAISVGGAPASFSSISNNNSFGYTAGFGLEWAFAGNWSVRAEYDYIGLRDHSLYGSGRDTHFRRRCHHVQQSQHLNDDRGPQLQIWRLVIAFGENRHGYVERNCRGWAKANDGHFRPISDRLRLGPLCICDAKRALRLSVWAQQSHGQQSEPQRQRRSPRHPRPAHHRLRTFRTGSKRWSPGSIGSNVIRRRRMEPRAWPASPSPSIERATS